MKSVRLKRVYEPAAADDGVRVLVDRIWPRGMTKERLKADRWMKDIAPSSALRKWFGHDPAKWSEFRKRYVRELEGNAELVAELRLAAGKKTVTLLFAAQDEEHNNAVVLAEVLRGR